MSLDFLNPHLFWLAALATVPLLMHLFARTKPPVYKFSSVDFLRRIVRKTTRLKKPQDILLLILRTLAVIALIAAFLRPLLFTQEKLSGLFQKKNLVIVVDASASMAYVEGAQTRFAKACAEAGELLGGMSAGDRANIIWMKAQPEAVFPDELASNFGYLKDQLRRAEVTYERGSPEKAFALANSLLADSEGKREICVVSDFQKSAWEDFEPPVPEGVDLIHVKIGRENAGNLAVTRITTSPDRPIVGEELVVEAEISNFSDADAETTLFSEVGENRRSRNLSVPAGQTAMAVFRHTMGAAGPQQAKVSLAEDNFPGDDRRSAELQVRPYMRLAVLPGTDPQTAKLWTRAAQALRWAVPESVAVEDVGEDFDAVLIPGAAEVEIPEATKVVLLPAVGSEGARREDSEDSFFSVAAAENNRTRSGIFRGSENVSFEGPAGSNRIRLDTEISGTPLLVYDDGEPAVIRTEPNRYLWLMPLDDTGDNFAARAAFVPFFAELLLVDRNVGGSNLDGLEFEPGDSVFWQVDGAVDRESLGLFATDGTEMEFSATEGNRFSSGPIAAPQVLEWRTGGGPVGLSVVNFPVSESNLESLTLEETDASASVAVRGGGDVRHLRDGLKLWPWLLSGAVLFFILESGVTLWAAKTP